MEVILLKDQRNLGPRGTVVDVKPGYGRNFLLPKGIALEATPGNIKYFEQQRAKIDARHTQEREAAAAVAAEIAGIKLEIVKRVSESGTLYGSVTASEIGEALEGKGVTVDNRRIDLIGGIKEVGDHSVEIHLHAEVTAELAVSVVPAE